MVMGILIMGLGVALFKLALMGNDPSSAMVMAIGDKIGLDFSIMLIIMNALFFVVEIIWGRKYIGIGTFFNWFGVGILTTIYLKIINSLVIIPDAFLPRLAILVAGILVLSLSGSLYQTADLGIAPYDCLSIVLNDKTRFQYYWCRIFTDAISTLICFLLGGIVGLGTLVCALGLGPFIQFFTKHVSRKLCGYGDSDMQGPFSKK
ncbi:MAG: hypothetical protein EOM40_11625 [Clostridia bacterium]|nr:hypothetical protein [Clostridia bacterium]NCC44703.1 hypothetical protein [Clostridia bacterium]